MPRVGPPELQAGSPRPAQTERNVAQCTRRSWARPALTVHGDLRELTMGPSPGLGESGNPLTLFAAP